MPSRSRRSFTSIRSHLKIISLLYMSYSIVVTNITNHSLALFGQGDTLKFSISPRPKHLKHISWKFSDNISSNLLNPSHIFVVPDSAIPGQGFAHVKVYMKIKHDCIKLK